MLLVNTLNYIDISKVGIDYYLLPHWVWSALGSYPEEHWVQMRETSWHVPHVDRVVLQSGKDISHNQIKHQIHRWLAIINPLDVKLILTSLFIECVRRLGRV